MISGRTGVAIFSASEAEGFETLGEADVFNR